MSPRAARPIAPPQRKRRRWSSACVLFLGVIGGACLGGPSWRRPEVLAGDERPSQLAPLEDPWSARGLVPVRLVAFERAGRVEVDRGRGTTLEVWRSMSGVVRSDARQLLRSVEIEPAAGSPGVRIAGRLHPGVVRITPHPERGLRVEALLDLENYVSGVVSAELALWSAPPAQLEAQAVAARSYALARLAERADGPFVWDGVEDQAYRGQFEPDAASAKRGLEARLESAIERTRGQVLWAGGGVLPARYHARCGGRTSTVEAVFGKPGPGHAPAACPTCSADLDPESGNSWRFTASRAELDGLARRLGLGSPLIEVRPIGTDRGGRWLSAQITGPQGSKRIDANQLRRELGWDRLRSAWIEGLWPSSGRPAAGGIEFSGRGHGHGVGLCQVGARGLAERGWSATQILAHYYPTARLMQYTPPTRSRPLGRRAASDSAPSGLELRSPAGHDPGR